MDETYQRDVGEFIRATQKQLETARIAYTRAEQMLALHDVQSVEMSLPRRVVTYFERQAERRELESAVNILRARVDEKDHTWSSLQYVRASHALVQGGEPKRELKQEPKQQQTQKEEIIQTHSRGMRL